MTFSNGAIRIHPLVASDADGLFVRYARWPLLPAAALPVHALEAGKTVRDLVASALTRGRGWVARDGTEITGFATFEPLAWDTDFFGVPCGQVTLFHADSGSVATLAKAMTTDLRAAGAGHVRTTLTAAQRRELASLQSCGWCLAASSLVFVFDSARFDPASLAWPADAPPGLTLVPYEPSHLEALVEQARRVGPTSWLEHEPSLPEAARRAYTAELTRSCLSTDFADVRVVLLDHGRPVAMNASKLFDLPTAAGGGQYTFERFALVDPEQRNRGLSRLLLRAYLSKIASRARYVTSRVRLDNTPMMHTVFGACCRPSIGQHFLALR